MVQPNNLVRYGTVPVVWSRERAEAKQAELIGMTAVNEIDDSVFSRVEGVKATFETEE